MKVKELIEKLKEFDEKLDVKIEKGKYSVETIFIEDVEKEKDYILIF